MGMCCIMDIVVMGYVDKLLLPAPSVPMATSSLSLPKPCDLW